MAETPLATQANLLNDTNFKNRTTMAILHTASNIQNEDPGTPNHDNRVGLANQAFSNPWSTQQAMYAYIVIQPSIYAGAADSSTITDQTIMDAVSAIWDQMSKVLYVAPPAVPGVLTAPAPAPAPAA